MDKTGNQIVGKRMRQVRRASNMTQAELAKRLYISRSCLANYESSRRTPSIQILNQITKHLNVDLAYLTGKDRSEGLNAKLKEYDVNISDYLNKDGFLDLSNESPIVRIAVVEYYLHLKGKYEL